MVSESLKTFFGKVKKGLSERLSEMKPEEVAKFATKEAGWAIPVVGEIIKDAFDEFSPDEKEELIKELKELSEGQFEEISEEVGVSVEYLKYIQKFTLYAFKELRADHEEIKELIQSLIENQIGEVKLKPKDDYYQRKEFEKERLYKLDSYLARRRRNTKIILTITITLFFILILIIIWKLFGGR